MFLNVFLSGSVPAPDPIPLPAPYWLFKILLIVTFFLHLLAMNGAVGGGAIAAVAQLGGERRRRLASEIAAWIPSFIAATITLGVAVLLFTQVLYGQALYTSSILMAWPWLGALGLLVIGYYGFYRAAFRAKSGSGVPPFVLVGSVLLFLAIAFVFTNNMTLALTPEKWADRYHADPSGFGLNLDEPTLLPRYLHFLIAAVAVGGLLVVGLGLLRHPGDPERGRYLVNHGGRWFLGATLVEIGVGLWFLMALPREQMLIFMGKNLPATIYLSLGMLGSVLAMVFMFLAMQAERPRRPAVAALATTGAVIFLMVLMRDALRDAYLAPHVRPAELAVKTQAGPLAIFLLLFVAGAALWVWMLVRYFRSARAAAARK